MASGDTPGPDAYVLDVARHVTESSVKNNKFSREKKGFWLDKELIRDTPGPIYRPSKHFASRAI